MASRKVSRNPKVGPWGEQRTALGASCSATGEGLRQGPSPLWPPCPLPTASRAEHPSSH